MSLLITESPAKAKKIQGFLSNQYTVKSSCGHITDLEKKKLSIDVDNNFQPTYKVTSDKREVVKMLKYFVPCQELVIVNLVRRPLKCIVQMALYVRMVALL